MGDRRDAFRERGRERKGVEMLECKCACLRETEDGKMENEEGEGLSSFDCLWPSCPVYRQHPSPWRQSLSSAAAKGEKSAKKKKKGKKRRVDMKHSKALLTFSK